jgi:hypothetical protein
MWLLQRRRRAYREIRVFGKCLLISRMLALRRRIDTLVPDLDPARFRGPVLVLLKDEYYADSTTPTEERLEDLVVRANAVKGNRWKASQVLGWWWRYNAPAVIKKRQAAAGGEEMEEDDVEEDEDDDDGEDDDEGNDDEEDEEEEDEEE